MNIFDIITLVVLLWAVVSGWRTGFAAQLLSFAGIVAGLILAVRFGAQVGAWLGIDAQFAAVAGFVITFVVAVIVALVATKFLKAMLSFVGLHSIDTILGIALSMLKYLLILSVAYAAFGSLNDDLRLVEKRHIAASRTFAPVRNASECIFPYIKWLKEQIPTSATEEHKGKEEKV